MTEKLVLGISLGPSRRDHEVCLDLPGQAVRLLRRGTDGSLERALELLREHDGVADAIGLGGTNLYLDVAGKHYPIRDGQRMAAAVTRSKLGDGNRVKSILAREAVKAAEAAGIALQGRPALITSAVDRWSLAEALVEAGCELVYADLMVGMGLPWPLRTPEALATVAWWVLPVLLRLPTRFFYPSGESSEGEPSAALVRELERAEIIAGDFLQVQANLPERLDGKVIVTNTTTAADVEELRARGLRALVTSTPRLEGRSFGTNVMEALALALVDKPRDQISDADLAEALRAIPIRPAVEIFET
jgi:hypothetical protein